MTSLQHDDGIEVIGFQQDNHDEHSQSGFYSFSSPTDSTSHVRIPCYCHLSIVTPATVNKNIYFSEENGDRVCVLSGKKEVPTEKQKRVARVVMVVAGALLLMSVLLVAVTLTMSDHIDEMVRKANGMFTTSSTPRTNRSVSYYEQTDYTER